jgi:hypothetical protein
MFVDFLGGLVESEVTLGELHKAETPGNRIDHNEMNYRKHKTKSTMNFELRFSI